MNAKQFYCAKKKQMVGRGGCVFLSPAVCPHYVSCPIKQAEKEARERQKTFLNVIQELTRR